MPLSAADSGRPVFLFGFGRCGSTFWQTLLCRAGDLWIWGEHGGFLWPLLNSRHLLHEARGIFPGPGDPTIGPDGLVSEDAGDGTRLAWNNGFRATDLDDELRHLIDALMRRGLPEHKSRWGFKEIRYGWTVDSEPVPLQLMELFPCSTTVLTLRHPRPTIESTVKAGLQEPTAVNLDHVRDLYDSSAKTWRRMMDCLIKLAEDVPERVVQVRIEDIPAGRAALEAALGVEVPADHPRVNALPEREHDAELDRCFDECWLRWRHKLAGAMLRAGYAPDA